MMFGHMMSIPIPDIDRTQHMLIMGANPLVSNGSLMTAPNFGERLRRIKKRGGKIVVIDPLVTKTAESASEHLFIIPGTDIYFLFAMVNVLFDENLVNLGSIKDWLTGIDEIQEVCGAYPPEKAAPVCGIPADEIRRITREFAAAESACL